MTRAEHLEWCKSRALEYVDAGELTDALTSMLSDLTKHPDTEASAAPTLMMLGMMHVQQGDTEAMRRFIKGFN